MVFSQWERCGIVWLQNRSLKTIYIAAEKGELSNEKAAYYYCSHTCDNHIFSRHV